jgi:hypothetical protein
MSSFATDAVLSIFRHVLTLVGGIIITKGWLSADLTNQIIGVVISLMGVGMAQVFHAQANDLLSQPSATTTKPSAAPVPSGIAAFPSSN